MTSSLIPTNNLRLTICSCCGERFSGNPHDGCSACGARAVGPPLTPPANRLPALGRAAFAFMTGAVLLLALIGGTLVELVSGTKLGFKFWTIVAAAETIAWRAKLTLLPAAILSSYLGLRYVLRQRVAAGEPLPGGRSFARSGVLMSASVACLTLILIGVTIPERLRQREIARQAEIDSLRYMTHALMLRHQNLFGTLPTDITDLRNLPDADAEVSFVLANFNADSYKPSSVQAVARAPRIRGRRSSAASTARVRPVAYRGNTNDATTSGLTFTNYDLVWAGEDKLLGTEDDRIIRDGEFIKPRAHQTPPPASPATPSGTRTDTPARTKGSR